MTAFRAATCTSRRRSALSTHPPSPILPRRPAPTKATLPIPTAYCRQNADGLVAAPLRTSVISAQRLFGLHQRACRCLVYGAGALIRPSSNRGPALIAVLFRRAQPPPPSAYTEPYSADGYFTGVRSTITIPRPPAVVYIPLARELYAVLCLNR